MSKYVSKYVSMKCDNCGKDYELNAETLRGRIKNNIPNYCKDCMKKFAYKKLSDINKEIWKNKTSKELAEHSVKISTGMNNMSEEQKKSRGEKLSKFNKKRYEDPNERLKTGAAVKQGLDNMSEESKQKMHDHRSESQRKRFEDPEERRKASIASKAVVDSLSKEERERFRYLSNLPYEERIKIELKNAMINNESCLLVPDKFDNKTEKEFYWYMKNKDIRIGYHFSNIIPYPTFHQLFPYNPTYHSNYVSPFHEWDFVVFTYKIPILIDIDGSSHNIQNNYPRKLAIEFNDSKRPYQTDGYPTYIVLCYEDFFDGFNKVIDINDQKKEMNMLDLLSIISEYNDPKYLEENNK